MRLSQQRQSHRLAERALRRRRAAEKLKRRLPGLIRYARNLLAWDKTPPAAAFKAAIAAGLPQRIARKIFEPRLAEVRTGVFRNGHQLVGLTSHRFS